MTTKTTDSEMRSQLGITTAQIKSAPIGAIYIWVTNDTWYPKALAKHLGREDIQFKSHSWFTLDNVIGKQLPIIIFDHHVKMTTENLELLASMSWN